MAKSRVPLSHFAASLDLDPGYGELYITDAPGIVQLRLLAHYINNNGNQAWNDDDFDMALGIDFEDDIDLSQTLYTNCDIWSVDGGPLTNGDYEKGAIVFNDLGGGTGYVAYCHTSTDDNEEPSFDIAYFGDGFIGNHWMALYIVTDGVGAGHLPIGTAAYPVTIPIYGNRFKIKNLYINRPGTDYIGLFGLSQNTTFRDFILSDVNITGRDTIGAILGANSAVAPFNLCNFYNIKTTGQIAGRNYSGGVCGNAQSGFAENCISYCNVIFNGTGTTNGGWMGGLFGNSGNAVTKCASYGNVTGVSRVGGLCGTNVAAGLSGLAWASGSISDSFAFGNVTTSQAVGEAARSGGLVGFNLSAVTNSYSIGLVTKTANSNNVGGLLGANGAMPTYPEGVITNSYWNTETSNQAESAGGTGKTTLEMQQLRSIAPWDFIGVWQQRVGLKHNNGYPSLLSCDGRIIKRRRELGGSL